jgi:hypothetical protein
MKALIEGGVSRVLLACGAAFLLGGAVQELYAVAWGTGSWYGEFSMKWGLAFGAFCLFCAALLAAWLLFLWGGTAATETSMHGPGIPGGPWIPSALAIALPILLLQYTPWGVVIRGPYLRILLWVLCLAAISVSTPHVSNGSSLRLLILGAIIVSGSALMAAAALTDVTGYPFSLGWSEGNRLWDYSLLFGKRLYSFEAGNEPAAYLDFGRQLIGGLPFLLPKVSIVGVRLWLGVVAIIPYMLVGFLTFWPRRRAASNAWIFLSLAGFMFLSQGPIHAPLLLCAVLVAAAWRLPLRWAVPLVAVSGFFAESSRFTWMFAPAIWIVMLELGSAVQAGGRLESGAWRRSVILGISGLMGSAAAYAGLFTLGMASVGSSASVSTSQALLWYRLLPNATYGDGILLGLVKAAAPLAVLLVFLGGWHWKPTTVQILIVALSLLAFLAVGLVVSTKIGGGGDLHNLDMFLIGMLFTAGILWRTSETPITTGIGSWGAWVYGVLLLLLAVPANGALQALRPISFADDAAWLSVLADVERPRDLGSLPNADVTASSLDRLRQAVAESQGQGDILFMDQRQLLTFGFVEGVLLVPEYEKKRMMDEALSGNAKYFDGFYRELSARRFSLLISSPLRTPIQDSEYGFGEENNAWVKWVARPILCYYEEKDTLNEAKIELLVPRTGPVDCESVLPAAR